MDGECSGVFIVESDIDVGLEIEVASDVIVEEKEDHKILVEEAFIYLFDKFGIRSKTQDEFQFLRKDTGYALITIAYIYRKRMRTYFRTVADNAANIDEFLNIVKDFELVRDECYFYRLLKRLSHIFELTAYCWNLGHDYIDTIMESVEIADDIDYFEGKGGLLRLNMTAAFIANAGIRLSAIIKLEKPQDEVLISFVRAVHNLERPFGNEWEIIKKGMLSMIKDRANNVLRDVNNFDLRLLKVYYQVLCQHNSKVIVMHRGNLVENMYRNRNEVSNYENEKRAIINSFRNVFQLVLGDVTYLNLHPAINLAECFGFFRHLTDLISPVLEMPEANVEIEIPDVLSEEEKKCYSYQECFVVSHDYVTQRLQGQNDVPRPLNENFITVPTRRRIQRTKVKKTIDGNIAMNNYFLLMDEIFIVYTPDCKFDHTTTTILYN